VIIFKTYFENDQNILTSSWSMGFLPIKLMIIIISTFSIFFYLFLNVCLIIYKLYCATFSQHFFSIIICTKISDVISTIKFMVNVFSL
jgi:hypothetical protein